MARPRGADPVRSDVAHLLRRTGFGAPAATVDDLADLGYAGAVDEVLRSLTAPDPAADAVDPPSFDTVGYLQRVRGDRAAQQAAQQQARTEARSLVAWWLRRMVAADHPAREKLTFLWHDHFATSLVKVKVAELLHLQWQTLQQLATGPYDDLVRAMTVDPAMLVWLDGRHSTNEAPNENYGRELLELFTLGHGDGHHAGQPYTEADVREVARALTGWVIRPDGSTVLEPARHDAGPKRILGEIGSLGLDDVVRLTTRHEACAPHVVSRLWSRLAFPVDPADEVVTDLAPAFGRDLDVGALLRRLLLHPAFRSDVARTGLVRMPVDFVVGTLRALPVELPEEVLLSSLHALGQLPFVPPDVAGWPKNEAWLSTASAQARFGFAVAVATRAEVPEVADATPAERPAVLARLLSVDGWHGATAAALVDAPDQRRALTIALASPENLVA